MKQIDKELLESVISEARKSPRLRKNYNFHQSLDDKCRVCAKTIIFTKVSTINATVS